MIGRILGSFALIMACILAPASISYSQAQEAASPPDLSPWMAQPAILVFSKTRGWRHNEGIAGGDAFFTQLARQHQYGIYTTVDPSIFNPRDLAKFEVVVFNNMTGDTLNEAQEAAFENWLEGGGGWIGLHSAGDSSQSTWEWYQETLIGPRFIGHPADPQLQYARVEVLNKSHPVTAGLPTAWLHNDEWYSFDGRAQDHGMNVLIGLDESTYRPRNDVYGDVSDLRMGEGAENHPIVWSNCPGEGRAVYSAIGHMDESYEDPHYRRLLENAFSWVSGKSDPEGKGC